MRHVLTAMPVHILLAMILDPSILKKITMMVRDFLWHGRKDAKTGCCLFSWHKLTRPLEYGDLVVRDLHRTCIALCARWLWLQATDPDRPSSHLQLPHDKETQQFSRACMTWTIRDGRTCRFWCDHWIKGSSVAEIATTLIPLVPQRRRRQRLVCDAIQDGLWIHDIHGAMGPAAVIEYVELWRRIQRVQLTPDPDKIA